MNKYIFMAVAGMLALSSCSNDDNDQTVQNAPRQMTFTAGFGDGAQTRASLYDNMKKVKFDAGDQISILSANNNNVTFTTTAGGASATFNGTATAGDPTYYAVYPYTAGLTLSGTTISGVKIPMSQNAAATSTCDWDPEAPIAYATTTGTSLQFQNACALLKINNDGGYANEITVSCNETLTGTFSLNTLSGALLGGTYPFASVLSVPSDKTIYIAIAPGEKTDFTVNWYGEYDYTTKHKMSAVTFEAGKIYDLGNTSAWN